jgi:hypothetical protein
LWRSFLLSGVFMMRKLVASAALATALMVGGLSSASANTFDWTFLNDGYSASGTFIGTLIGPGPGGSTEYQLSGITGVINTDPITGLSGFASADNILYFPASTVNINGNTPPTFVDSNGISFSASTTGPWNIFNYSTFETGTAITNADACCGSVGTFNVAETPLPSTWTMLIAGFLGLGYLAYRGTKKGSAAFAAA